jgi:hypothetical protein
MQHSTWLMGNCRVSDEFSKESCRLSGAAITSLPAAIIVSLMS